MTKSSDNFYPDIEEYLESIGHGSPISTLGIEVIINEIAAKTNLNKSQAKIITQLFFQEIRSAILRGEEIRIRGLGRFYISSPATTKTKKKIFIKYKPSKSLIKKLNGK